MHRNKQIKDGKEAQASAGYDAFISQLYELYALKLLTYIHRQILSLHDAEDVLLDVFLMALQAASVLQSLTEDKQRAWLWTVARNRISDYYRRQKRRPRVSLESIGEMEDSAQTPEQAALRGEEDAELHRLIRKLPQQQQEVLTLRFLAELSCDEIAIAMDKSESAIRTMLSRAMSTLRRVGSEPKVENR